MILVHGGYPMHIGVPGMFHDLTVPTRIITRVVNNSSVSAWNQWKRSDLTKASDIQ